MIVVILSFKIMEVIQTIFIAYNIIAFKTNILIVITITEIHSLNFLRVLLIF